MSTFSVGITIFLSFLVFSSFTHGYIVYSINNTDINFISWDGSHGQLDKSIALQYEPGNIFTINSGSTENTVNIIITNQTMFNQLNTAMVELDTYTGEMTDIFTMSNAAGLYPGGEWYYDSTTNTSTSLAFVHNNNVTRIWVVFQYYSQNISHTEWTGQYEQAGQFSAIYDYSDQHYYVTHLVNTTYTILDYSGGSAGVTVTNTSIASYTNQTWFYKPLVVNGALYVFENMGSGIGVYRVDFQSNAMQHINTIDSAANTISTFKLYYNYPKNLLVMATVSQTSTSVYELNPSTMQVVSVDADAQMLYPKTELLFCQ
ncbi:hypothetical protein CYY_002391 [Polysphondylium violaceum]|uniref:Ricin B lectin domain-containing protein n=1 Tax=Polysphondylium violaceum TaxID=133409 RepID=A0A8J4UV62_9MYCE|nr:hypothetical protein CYY_002391 [Polysphondylium violaceum]